MKLMPPHMQSGPVSPIGPSCFTVRPTLPSLCPSPAPFDAQDQCPHATTTWTSSSCAAMMMQLPNPLHDNNNDTAPRDCYLGFGFPHSDHGMATQSPCRDDDEAIQTLPNHHMGFEPLHDDNVATQTRPDHHLGCEPPHNGHNAADPLCSNNDAATQTPRNGDDV